MRDNVQEYLRIAMLIGTKKKKKSWKYLNFIKR